MIFERNYFLWASCGAWIFNIYLASLWNQFWYIGTPWRSPLFLYREEKVGDDLDGSRKEMAEIDPILIEKDKVIDVQMNDIRRLNNDLSWALKYLANLFIKLARFPWSKFKPKVLLFYNTNFIFFVKFFHFF